LRRVAALPLSMGAKAAVTAMQSAARINVGLESATPNPKYALQYTAAVKAALLPKGARAWVRFPLLLIICLQGHRIAIDAMQALAVFKIIHRKLSQGDGYVAMWLDLYHSRDHFKFVGGIVGTFTNVVSQLDWQWMSPYVVSSDLGWNIDLRKVTWKCLAHLLRDSLRRGWAKNISSKRPDMFGIPGSEAGIDIEATTRLIRSKSSLSDHERSILNHFLSGNCYLQVRTIALYADIVIVVLKRACI
jgi:hypothetical protein